MKKFFSGPGALFIVILGLSMILILPVARAGKLKDPATYFGTVHQLQGTDVEQLREILISIGDDCKKLEKKCPASDQLFDLISGDFNMADRPVHILYIDEDNQVRTNVMVHRQRVTPLLYGQRLVWMAVFAENDLDLEAGITTLWRQKKSSLTGLDGVFVSAGRETTEAREAQGTSMQLEFDRLSGAEAGDDLYYSTAQFFIEPLGVYNVSVYPGQRNSEETTGFVEASANFSNSLSRSIDVGLALGATLRTEPIDDLVLDGVQVGDANLNLYIMLDIYIIKPAVLSPMVETVWGRYRPSIGIAIGTNLTFWEAQEFNVGVSVGHLFGRHGLVFGVNIIDSPNLEGAPTEGSDSDDRLIRPFIAGLFKF